ncbi:amidohydrolase [Flaviaesturariibacter flavus]|uniref:Amidohydrolase n=1 Tax=Flaviaesturariibacter flavus TaxID=2502780 RepID=A0A4R1BPV0_9BACT|nr:amidohydrolase family protein [Flaviaesturariibacter flavus]TCJ19591.1 amidohydrolase [Flaviaesturariibacter flavus]
MRIDAHQHFWKFDPVRDSWINDDMSVIRRDFLPEDLEPLLHASRMDGCVAVQADQSEAETRFLLELAEQHRFIKGVVGWIDLQSSGIEERLDHYSSFPLLKGFRHILQGEAQRDLMLSPAFTSGIAALQARGYTYDILIYPDQLRYAGTLAAQFPGQAFVVDHLAKPKIKSGETRGWKVDIEALAAMPNVCCKLSGFVTEADWKDWKEEDFEPYFDIVLNAFGPDRVLFGTDWPVCLLAAGYERVLHVVERFVDRLSETERAAIMGGNATRFYKLEDYGSATNR